MHCSSAVFSEFRVCARAHWARTRDIHCVSPAWTDAGERFTHSLFAPMGATRGCDHAVSDAVASFYVAFAQRTVGGVVLHQDDCVSCCIQGSIAVGCGARNAKFERVLATPVRHPL